MTKYFFRIKLFLAVTVVLMSFLCIQYSVAQLTFSKNWKPGKREQGDQKVSINSLCHFLVVSMFNKKVILIRIVKSIKYT